MELLSAAQAAARAGVRTSSVSRWVAAGKLKAGRLESGTLQIAVEDLDVFLALRTSAPRTMPPDVAVALAVAQERVRGLEALLEEALLEQELEWRREAEARVAMLLPMSCTACAVALVVLAMGERVGGCLAAGGHAARHVLVGPRGAGGG